MQHAGHVRLSKLHLPRDLERLAHALDDPHRKKNGNAKSPRLAKNTNKALVCLASLGALGVLALPFCSSLISRSRPPPGCSSDPAGRGAHPPASAWSTPWLPARPPRRP